MTDTTLADLLEAGVHFGHQSRRWNPKMFPYIYAERNGIHIIDLVQTSYLLSQACDFVYKSAQEGKKFLFVGTKRQASSVISQEAEKCGAYYVNHRWLGGTLTNWFTIKTRVEYLRDLEQKEENGYLDQLPKKEASCMRKELEKLRKNLNGIKQMKRLPDLVIVVDQKRENTAIQECIKLQIPIISLLDTNCDPELTDIPIPANDDAIRSIKLILGKLSDSIRQGNIGSTKSEE
jgi:small subunit ribosomal protein S2|uniref:ribosomal protein S2 n=1 Tax=Cryptomonas gyropyrenoidosa TaxID=233257 RepID=UPI0027A1B446|nr:ribosomal protein S2 [Cryptomonas gyropyrenoidosa]WFQ82969.1 ribosomal protein S2 [Cryptomonas gyropyrenoidosa]